MPTIQLSVDLLRSLPVLIPAGGTRILPLVRLRCVLRLPNGLSALDAIIDTGAPLTYFPRAIWTRFREGIDFEWLPFAPGVVPPVNHIAGWRFTFRFARFLVPLALMDYTTAVDRLDVIAAFASSDPPLSPSQKNPPPVVIGLSGGLLEDGAIHVTRDPVTGRIGGAVAVA